MPAALCFQPGGGVVTIKIDIISDTVCPWCYVGKRRLEKALAERPDIAVEVAWRPFQLNPDMPPEGMDRDQYMDTKFGNRGRADSVYRSVGEAGAAEGIDFNFAIMQRVPNTIDSHRLLRWATGDGVQDAVSEILFRRYFIDGADIGDARVLAAAAGEAGMDAAIVGDLLAGDADREAVMGEDQAARRMGISGVPCFIIDGKYAIMGAQQSSAYHAVLERALAEAAEATSASLAHK